ncbi:uncharacterized protein LOC136042115 [Artemia franciscana]|uniref:uncharacterized protein LOC136042115 n=1 Tax=Artemia franciscana TaxID=6661 RepID=UPI0032DB2AD0
MKVAVGLTLYSAATIAVPLQNSEDYGRKFEKRKIEVETEVEAKLRRIARSPELPFYEVNEVNVDRDLFGLNIATSILVTMILGLLVGHVYENPLARFLRTLTLFPRRNGLPQQSPVATIAEIATNTTQKIASQGVANITSLSNVASIVPSGADETIISSLFNWLSSLSGDSGSSVSGESPIQGFFTNLPQREASELEQIIMEAINDMNSTEPRGASNSLTDRPKRSS